MEHVTKLCLNLRHIDFILEYIRNFNRNFTSAHLKEERRGWGGRERGEGTIIIRMLLVLCYRWARRLRIVQNYEVKVRREKEGQAIIQVKSSIKLELKKVEQKTSRHDEMMWALKWWFQTGGNFSPQGTMAICEDNFGCHNYGEEGGGLCLMDICLAQVLLNIL